MILKAQNLMKVTHQCLMEAIGVIKPGEKISQIGKVVTTNKQLIFYRFRLMFDAA